MRRADSISVKSRLRAAEQAGGELAIDVDEVAELLGMRVGHQRHRLLDDEQAEIGDVLTDRDGKGILVLCGFGEENRPQPAIVEERVVEPLFLPVPGVADRLQLGRRLKQQGCFQLAGVRRLRRYLAVGLCRVLHGRGVPVRMRSISSLLSMPYTSDPLRYDYS